MGRPVARYSPSRHYLTLGLVALACGVFSTWCGLRWLPALFPAGVFAVFTAALLALYFRPAIEIHETHLQYGRTSIPWGQIRRLDRTGWIAPLVVHLTLLEDRRILLFYPGDLESANSLLRHLRKLAREALIDGIPYRQFWGEALAPGPQRQQLPSPKYPLLRPEDEAEVERLFQRLKTVGRLDAKSSPDEK